MFQEKTGEGGVLLQTADEGLRDDTPKQRCVPAEAVGVDLSAGIYVGSMFDQPAGDLDFIEVDAHMQECRPCEGSAVQRQ